MLYDQRYRDNVILKREALQNILTNIKNYPIIDIDYMPEDEIDELHANNVWQGYTDHTPCLKITYGDERSKKGNIIFAEELRRTINERKKTLSEQQLLYNNKVYEFNKLELAFEENKTIQTEKETQLDRIKKQWHLLVANKEAYLRAGLSILNFPFSTAYTQEDFRDKHGFADLASVELKNAVLSDVNLSLTYQNIDLHYNDTNKTVTVTYSQLGKKTALLSELAVLKDAVIPGDEHDTEIFDNSQKTFIQAFIDFVKAYDYLSFWEAFSIEKGFDAETIARVQNGSQTSFNFLDDESNDIFFNKLNEIKNDPSWDYNSYATNDFTAISEIFYNTMQDIINRIKTIINNNLIRIRNRRNTLESEIATLKNTLDSLKDQIAALESQVLEQAGNRVIYGYKYVRLDPNIKWTGGIYDTNSKKYGNFDEVEIKKRWRKVLDYNTPESESTSSVPDIQSTGQASGTFRMLINDQIYEIPIKGFGNKISDQPVQLRTTKTINIEATQQINTKGNIASSGNIVTNNGHIYASSGAIGAATYLALRGYPVNASGQAIDTYKPENTGGFWYDGQDNRRLLRTWNITLDNNTVRLGTYQLALINDSSTSHKGVGLRNNNGVLEARNIPEDTEYVDFRAKSILTTGSMDIDVTNNPVARGQLRTLLTASYKDVEGQTYLKRPILSAIGTGLASGGANASFYFGSPDGTTIIGAGEGACKSAAIIPAYNDENIYLVADGQIGLYVNANNNNNSGASILGFTVDTSGNTNIYRNLWVGGFTSVVGNTGISGALTVSGNTTLNGATTINNYLTVGNTSVFNARVEITNGTAASSKTTGALTVTGGIGCSGNIYGNKIYNAVYNDYAEYRATIDLKPGSCVVDKDNGDLEASSKRLQPGAQIISDTFGHVMGESENCKTPLAVAGRVLAYPYRDRYKYHAGMAVCSAPDGTIDIMTRKEIRDYPDCIVGIVSEIPAYEYWGTDNIKVDGRIWIKVK